MTKDEILSEFFGGNGGGKFEHNKALIEAVWSKHS